jgi:tight adherence protein B
MSGSVFLLAFVSSIICYATISLLVDRRLRAASLRRLSGKEAALGSAHRAAKPALMQSGDEVRGRLAMRLLERIRLKQAAERMLETAGLKWGAAGLAHRSAGFFVGTFLVVTIYMRNQQPLAALAAAAVGGWLPVAYVRHQARARLRKFEEQFPECLEFISRSMRAGHAFSVALEMTHREFSDPLAAEFRRTFEEQNLGQPMEIVLKKLSQRIPSMDVQFFVSAVLLQRRTGGNLAELLDKLAYIIRERFKLRARVRAISAQGLMSGRILASIPLAVAGLMFVVNPQYARFFIDDPMGHTLVGGAVALELVGYMIIRKIVVIEV